MFVNRSRRGNDGVDDVEIDTLSRNDFGPPAFMELGSVFMVHEVSPNLFLVLRPVFEDLVGSLETGLQRLVLPTLYCDFNGGVVEFGSFASRLRWLDRSCSTPIL